MNMQEIINYLSDCRWCNLKKDIEKGNISDIKFEKMPFDDGQKLFVIGEAEISDGQKRYFSMPLARKAAMPLDKTVIIMDGQIYVDALQEPDFFRSLMRLMDENDGCVRFANGWTLERRNIGSQEAVEAVKDADCRALGVEQSNTTLNVGDGRLAFKLERMLEFSDEINSELEMNEKLMRENCSVMPKSFGGLIWRMPDGRQASSGIMQEFVKNKGDMWSYLQAYLDKKLAENYLSQRDLTAAENPEFMGLIRNLSAKTAEMGACFARPDSHPNFAPEPVDDNFLRIYEGQFKALSVATKQQIELYLDHLPEATRQQAERILETWDESVGAFVGSRLEKIRQATGVERGIINRVHGDFHLGQVMVTPDNDLRFIDFAGEPELPMAQRKQKHIYVRDVAGMYRSIKGYLGSVAVENFAAEAPDELRSVARKKWAQAAIKPLIDSAALAFLGKHSMKDPWLSLEVLRKNFYEVNYEVCYRPKMAYVPVSSLSDLLKPEVPTAVNENIRKTDMDRTA